MFINDELIRAENLSLSKEMAANRIYTLNEILNGKNEIVVANLASVLRFLPEKQVFLDNTIKFKVGQEINLIEVKKKLVKAGYFQVNKVDQSLQFASRGDIPLTMMMRLELNFLEMRLNQLDFLISPLKLVRMKLVKLIFFLQMISYLLKRRARPLLR